MSVDLPTLGRPTNVAKPLRPDDPDSAAFIATLPPVFSALGRDLHRGAFGTVVAVVLRRGAFDEDGRESPAASAHRRPREDESPVVRRRPRLRDLAQHLAEEPADRVDLFVVEFEAEELPISSSGIRALTRKRPGPSSTTSSTRASYSSAISPTSSSMRSSSVTRPAIPPYSSTTRHTCTASRFICCNSVSARIDSGTKTAGRAMPARGASRQPRSSRNANCTRSLR